MVNLAIIGMGIVGSKVISIINQNQKNFLENYGIDLRLNAIFEYDGALINDSGLNLENIINSSNIRDLPDWKKDIMAKDEIANIEAEIVIETTPVNPDTGEPALTHIILALNSGKHIVTSNKGPFYLKYGEIKKIAEEKNVTFGFESTVGSAIPLLAAKKTLAGNKVKKILAV
ncbi:MAG: hypothetical protein GY870_09595, partial [archaeon]|nr:hypothetical protein [archaeon]